MTTKQGTSGTAKSWRFVEALGVLIAFGALGIVGTMRDDVLRLDIFAKAADLLHIDYKKRLDYLERPELLIQLAQASSAVADVEATAQLAAENAAAIGLVQLEQRYQRGDLARQEGYLLQLLEAANVTPKRAEPPAPRPAEGP